MTHQDRRRFIGTSLAAASGVLIGCAHATTDCGGAAEMSAASNPI
jgi:hypothetical protein